MDEKLVDCRISGKLATVSGKETMETVADIVLFSLLILFHRTSSTSLDTIAADQSITDGNLVISRGGKFALGFFSPGSSSFRYLGIWYYDIPERTVLWVANRDNPITGSSGVLSISPGNCNLLLYNSSNNQLPVWSANVSSGVNGPCEALLLDSGNLALMEGESKKNTVWQSFDNPTDTSIPTMKVGLNRRTGISRFLTSWRSEDDPATGQFTYKLNPNGSPQFFVYKGTIPIWRSAPWPWETHLGYGNNTFVIDEDGIYFSNTFVNASIHGMVVIRPSGLLNLMVWDGEDNQWKVIYSSPKHECDFYGSCGPFAKCYSSLTFPFECNCLPGYKPRYPQKWDSRDRSAGCVRKRSGSSSFCTGGEGFVRVEKVKIPDASAAVWTDEVGMSKSKCEDECRKNCSCSAFATIDINGKGTCCWTWHGDLIDTIHLAVNAYDLYVRVDAIELADYLKESNSYPELRLKLSIVVPSIVSLWLVIILFAYLWLRKWNKRRVKNRRIRNVFHSTEDLNVFERSLSQREIKRSTLYPELPFFSLSSIREATESFSPANKLGQGGFGSVYKGKLSNGQEVAVKRLSKNSREGLEQFKNEVVLIAKLQHRNLVKLHGCCIEDDEQMLVYEYLLSSSLDSLIFVDQEESFFLDWTKRFNIILGIARGILYLHQDSRFRIIHRDLKPSNILLDAELNPKISDFGMARMLDSDQTQGKTSTVCGTYGYMSPEYVIFGRYSVKSDVFSFGVILLETVTGKKINGFFQENPSLSLIGHVWDLWKTGRVAEVINSSLSLKESNTALRCIQIGLLCTEENAADRPDMLTIVLMLNSEMTPLPSPKRPAFIVCLKSKLPSAQEQACSINEMSFSGVVFNEMPRSAGQQNVAACCPGSLGLCCLSVHDVMAAC
ncbi:G-type lectin S-receptor-like serine/threonine-protein kinase RKS1 [Linum perenne]